MRRPMDAPAIRASAAIYQVLLSLYPARFRREYGPKMAQVFRDCCLRSYHQKRGVGILELWTLTLFDLGRSLVEQHTQKETGMPNSNFIRLSGWAFIAGAVAFISILSGTDPIAVPTSLICAILLAVGLLGLRARYGGRVGAFGRNILLIGVVGMPLLYLVILIAAFAFQLGGTTLRLQLEELTSQGL